MTDKHKPEASGRGRHRGEFLDEQAQLEEDRAKGHLRPNEGIPGLGTHQKRDDRRGHQKGYGSNQEEEGMSRQQPWGTEPIGGEHG